MVSKRFFKKFSIILMIFLVSMSLMGSASAVGILASPGGFHLNMGTSQTYQGQVTVENIGNETLNVTVDKKRLQMDNVNLLFSDEGIATWITVEPTNFLLAPHQKQIVNFNVNLPSNINYYDAMGALVIRGYSQQSAQQTNGNLPNMQIQQVPELVVPIAVGLPGPIVESLQLMQHSAPSFLLSFMKGSFIYHVKNNGTVYANMTGDVDVKGWFNEHHLNMTGGVYPDDQYYLNTTWEPGILDLGLYDAKTTIKYGRVNQTQTLTTNDAIFVFPVWLIILIVLGITVWVLRKKEVKSPFKIKIEKRK